MKFVKRLFKFAFVMLLLAVVVAVVAFVRSRQQPDWYAQVGAYDTAQLEAAARQATQKAMSTAGWVRDRQAAELRERAGDTRAPLTPVPASVFTVTFTEQELNAIFQRWKASQGWEQLYSQYITNPVIALHDGRLILAGTVKQFDRVASFHFRPALDAERGELRLDLESVMAGKLPMPQALFDDYRRQLTERVAGALPERQRDAKLRPDGSVNDNAVQAAVGQLIVAVLDRKPVDAVLLLEGNMQGSEPRVVPVRVVQFAVEGKSMTVGVESMTPAQREAWLQRLRGPSATPAVADGPAPLQ